MIDEVIVYVRWVSISYRKAIYSQHLHLPILIPSDNEYSKHATETRGLLRLDQSQPLILWVVVHRRIVMKWYRPERRSDAVSFILS